MIKFKPLDGIDYRLTPYFANYAWCMVCDAAPDVKFGVLVEMDDGTYQESFDLKSWHDMANKEWDDVYREFFYDVLCNLDHKARLYRKLAEDMEEYINTEESGGACGC